MKKYLVLLITIAVSFLLIQSCKEKGTEPQPEPKPPGYQEDIPWASLADSPWPMYMADPQNTCRTDYIGPQTGKIDWIIEDNIHPRSGIVVGDSSIYLLGSDSLREDFLFAFNFDGSEKWKYPVGDIPLSQNTTPLIDNKNIIHFGTVQRNFYSISSSGELKNKIADILIMQAGINIDLDGNIECYDSWSGELISINNEGNVNWSYQNTNILASELNTMSASTDANFLFIPSLINGEVFYAFDKSSLTISWTFNQEVYNHYTAPIVDSYNNINFIAGGNESAAYLYSLNSSGNIRWEVKLGIRPSNSWLALNKAGDFYCGDDTLYSVDYQGKINWKKVLPDGLMLVGPMAIDGNNDIYIQAVNGELNAQFKVAIIKFSYDGVFKWRIDIAGRGGYPLAIGNDNSLYFVGFRSSIIAKIK